MVDSSGSRAHLFVEHVYRGLPEVAAKLAEGARVLEVGCGTARLPSAMARAFPGLSFVGIDPDGPAVEAAEVVWGSRHLSKEGLAALFAASGFSRWQFRVVHLPGQPSPRLVALVFW